MNDEYASLICYEYEDGSIYGYKTNMKPTDIVTESLLSRLSEAEVVEDTHRRPDVAVYTFIDLKDLKNIMRIDFIDLAYICRSTLSSETKVWSIIDNNLYLYSLPEYLQNYSLINFDDAAASLEVT